MHLEKANKIMMDSHCLEQEDNIEDIESENTPMSLGKIQQKRMRIMELMYKRMKANAVQNAAPLQQL